MTADHLDDNAAPDRAEARPTGRHFILGTAGHIDHGKTALIEALTGTNTDRLPEEKRRGMTIELGFAGLTIGEASFGIVDVPGHEKFVRTMVAGATGMDLALLVVAADDSVMPQTVEHAEILDLLGVRHGVVAVTKCDLVDDDLASLVEEDIENLLSGTALAGAPIVRVSSVARTGLDALCQQLAEIAGRIVRDELDQPFRMSIDRVFTVPGRGSVVTGSVVSGRLRRGESVDVWPIGERARVREVQSHGHDADVVQAGQRAAVNVMVGDKDALARGCELAEVDAFVPTRFVDVRMCCLKSHKRPIKSQSKLRLCIGTREVMVRCVVLGVEHQKSKVEGQEKKATAIEPGRWGFAQLRCAEPVTVTYGQRFILRDENAQRTAGGGMVLRSARRRVSARHTDEIAGLRALVDGDELDRVAEVLRDAHFLMPDAGGIALAAGVSSGEVAGLIDKLTADRRVVVLEPAGRKVSTAFLDAFLGRAKAWLRRYHQSHPDEPGALTETMQGWLERKSDKTLAKVLLAQLLEHGGVKQMGRYVCLKEFAPAISAQDEKLLAMVLDRLLAGGFQPPDLAALACAADTNLGRIRKLVKVACSTTQLVQINGSIFLHSDQEQELREKVTALHQTHGPFTVAQLREALSTSRKYAVPIAEYMDRTGITKRSGDLRELVETEKP